LGRPARRHRGSGAAHLQSDTSWQRPLLRLVKACDRQKVSPKKVADELARLNYEVHQKDKKDNEVHQRDSSVGPRCAVVWAHKGRGQSFFYNGQADDPHGLEIPTVADGIDYGSIFALVAKHVEGSASIEAGLAKIDPNELWRLLHRPPDERLP
jgi:hypothetical protein